MNTVTHALLPVLGVRFLLSRSVKVGWKDYVIIGLSGALPDILNPHLSLASRLTSWSHGLLGWVIFSVLVLIVAAVFRSKFSFSTAIMASLAYALHIFCDAIAGGVNWSYPISTNIWGGYWVSPEWWIPLDFVLVLSSYLIFRVFPIKSVESGEG